MRGSSMPQISSGWFLGSGIKVGSLSICHPSTPLRERAAERCDKPRRSSTRQSSRVVPSASRVAPALNTLLIGYGQSLLVRIGFEGWLISSASKRVPRRLTCFSAGTVMKGFPFVQALVEISSQEEPSRTRALILLPGFHWPDRDA